MKSSGTTDPLKTKLFQIDKFDELVSNFKKQIEGFNQYQKKLLRNGRHSKFYEQLAECVETASDVRKDRMNCIKQKLHNQCSQDYLDFKKCLNHKKAKNECNTNLVEYYICIDGSIKQILLSSMIDY